MNRNNVIEKIYNTLLQKGTMTSKPNVLSNDIVEDKVYTKRLNVNKTLGEGVNSLELVCITLSSSDTNFNNTTPEDVRVNTKNTREQWCNIFINETTDEMLQLIETIL